MLEIKIKNGEAEFYKIENFSMILPENKNLRNGILKKDLSAEKNLKKMQFRNKKFFEEIF